MEVLLHKGNYKMAIEVLLQHQVASHDITEFCLNKLIAVRNYEQVIDYIENKSTFDPLLKVSFYKKLCDLQN